jgi:pimeloyl-ACP methyl ester carboxylesterase
MEGTLLHDGFRLIVPNRPGYYGTPLSCGRAPADCADLAAELLDHLNIDRAAVIGTSGGGLGSASFAARHPTRTTCLVLQCALTHPFDTARWMPPHLQKYYWLFRYQRIFLPILRIGYWLEMRKLKQNALALLEYFCHDRPELRDDTATTTLLPLLAQFELQCAREPMGIENDWANDVGRPWLIPGSVSCPTLILHDRVDPLVTSAHVDWGLKCIPHAEHCDLHAGGHLIWTGRDAAKMRSLRREFLLRHSHAA